MSEERDLAHEADMRRLHREQLMADITAEEAREELADRFGPEPWDENDYEYHQEMAEREANLALFDELNEQEAMELEEEILGDDPEFYNREEDSENDNDSASDPSGDQRGAVQP